MPKRATRPAKEMIEGGRASGRPGGGGADAAGGVWLPAWAVARKHVSAAKKGFGGTRVGGRRRALPVSLPYYVGISPFFSRPVYRPTFMGSFFFLPWPYLAF